LSIRSPIVALHHYQEVFLQRFFYDDEGLEPAPDGLPVFLVLPQFTTDQARALVGNFPVIAGDELDQLPNLIDERVDAKPGSGFTPMRITELVKWLDEPEHISDQRLPLALSASARDIARNPGDARIRRVRGPAGSGKSMALASRAVALAATRKDVLVVSYNMTLGHYLHDLCARAARQQGVRRWKQAVSFTHFSGMLSELTKQQRLTRESGDIDTWTAWAIDELAKAYRAPDHQLPTYDAILVDEGQDFELPWWQFLRSSVLRPGGEMLLAADRTQNLYQRSGWTDSSIEGAGFSGPWRELKGSHRMPLDLVPIAAEFARTFLPDAGRDLPSTEQDHPGLADAHAPTMRRWINTSQRNVIDQAAHEVRRLISRVEGLSPSDIALLADHAPGETIMRALREHRIDTVAMFTEVDGERRKRLKSSFWAGTPGVKGCTIHSFKGWESRAVVVVSTNALFVELYIALTRVKFAPGRSAYITVINAVDELAPFKARFEREVLPSEVPSLAGQATIDI